MSGIDGGYGDALSPEQWLAEIDPFIGIVAAERTPAHLQREDVQQEMRIAAWRTVTTKRPDDMRPYLVATVKKRAVEAIVRQNWTGQPSQQGKGSDPLRRTDTDSLDAMIENRGVDFLGSVADALDTIQDAYHAGEVRQALDALDPDARAYCILRFWGGMTEVEIAAHLGLSKSGANNLWNRRVRPDLADTLIGLRERHLVHT